MLSRGRRFCNHMLRWTMQTFRVGWLCSSGRCLWDDPIYQNTRRLWWSLDNPLLFFTGKAGGYDRISVTIWYGPWVSCDDEGFHQQRRGIKSCALKMLMQDAGGQAFMHESFHTKTTNKLPAARLEKGKHFARAWNGMNAKEWMEWIYTMQIKYKRNRKFTNVYHHRHDTNLLTKSHRHKFHNSWNKNSCDPKQSLPIMKKQRHSSSSFAVAKS